MNSAFGRRMNYDGKGRIYIRLKQSQISII
jgi:hypothetical protein